MKKILEPTRELDVSFSCDVLVCGEFAATAAKTAVSLENDFIKPDVK